MDTSLALSMTRLRVYGHFGLRPSVRQGKKSTIFRFHNPFSVILSPCFKIYTTMLKFHKQKAIKNDISPKIRKHDEIPT